MIVSTQFSLAYTCACAYASVLVKTSPFLKAPDYINIEHATDCFSCVGNARKVSSNWLLETMTCHSSHCFSIVWVRKTQHW